MNDMLTSLSQAVQIIKTAILQSQEQTAKRVNADLLTLYILISSAVADEMKVSLAAHLNFKSINIDRFVFPDN